MLNKHPGKLDGESTDDWINRLIALENEDGRKCFLEQLENTDSLEQLYKAIPKTVPKTKNGIKRKRRKWRLFLAKSTGTYIYGDSESKP